MPPLTAKFHAVMDIDINNPTEIRQRIDELKREVRRLRLLEEAAELAQPNSQARRTKRRGPRREADHA